MSIIFTLTRWCADAIAGVSTANMTRTSEGTEFRSEFRYDTVPVFQVSWSLPEQKWDISGALNMPLSSSLFTHLPPGFLQKLSMRLNT